MISLKGMTWDHPRGYDPMIATSEVFKKKKNGKISITWDKRPLQAFADRPIEKMTDDYDLIVIDYPHVGEVAAKGVLDNFDKTADEYPVEHAKSNTIWFLSILDNFIIFPIILGSIKYLSVSISISSSK